MSESSSGSVLGVVRPDASRQEGLVAEAEVDPMEGEQTWPTEEELAQADGTTH